MTEKEKYFNMWKEAVNKAAEALKIGDIDLAEKYYMEMEDAHERYKEAEEYENGMLESSFAHLNMVLESAVPELYIKNHKALGDCIKLIKEDKNLSNQFKFYNALRKFDCGSDVKDYINESLEMVSKDIDYKTLKESNKKLAKMLIKHNIGYNNTISESENKFAESCDYLLLNKKKLSNLSEINNNIKSVGEYLMENNKQSNTEKVNVLAMAENVDKKLNALNESERALVKDIMCANSMFAEERRHNLFNKIKNECVDKINKMLSESGDEDKERLLNIKETIMMKEYDKNTIVEDIAKLLEIGAVLSDNDHDKFL